MIEKEEIDHTGAELGVHVSNVQRDYVFGWLLAGLFHPTNALQSQLILKGGNAFRKAYFEQARFSNDLDFSTQTELNEEVLRGSVKQACQFAQEQSGVEFLPDDNRIGVRQTAGENRMYEARVYFKSFYAEEHLTLKVELDVQEYDRIFLPIQNRQLIHSYSDSPQCKAEIRCQKLEELLASKLKALLQRRHSPDLYDFVYSVFFQKLFDVRRLEVVSTFLKKTIYEPSPLTARNLLLGLPFQILRGFWNQYLVCPKPSIITFDDAEKSFRTVIEELFALLAPQRTLASAGAEPGLSYYGSTNRNIIIEAGRLQRLLKIVYKGLERVVEPYALVFKRPQGGIAREYFYAWDPSGGRSGIPGIRSYFAHKVQSIRMTEQTFEPRFPIELAKGSGNPAGAYFSTPTFHSSRRRQSVSSVGGPFTVECIYCRKRFKRDHYDTRLNKHNNRSGSPCYGRVGVIVS